MFYICAAAAHRCLTITAIETQSLTLVRGTIESGIVVMVTIGVWQASLTIRQADYAVAFAAGVLRVPSGTSGTQVSMALATSCCGLGVVT